MKKILALFLAILTLVPMLLASCDGGYTDSHSTSAAPQTPGTTQTSCDGGYTNSHSTSAAPQTPGTPQTPPDASECTHSAMSDWSFTDRRTCEGQGFYTRTCAACGHSEEELRDMPEAEPEYRSLNKKTVMFLGNSFVYYGYCVMEGGQGNADRGYFYHICKDNGESVNVYDYVWGGITLDKIYREKLQDAKAKQIIARTDVVFMSEAGQNNAALIDDIKNIMSLFPEKTEFFYLNHAFTVSCGHDNITNSFNVLKKMGVGIVNWGALAYDVWIGRTKVPGGTLKYNKNSFVVNKHDTHHQNMLSGYITAQMAYCAYTLRSAQSQDYTVATNTKLSAAFNPESYMSSFYNKGTTNIDQIMKSEAEMRGFQVLMDKYLDKEGIKVGKQLIKGEHDYVTAQDILSPGDKDCKALAFVECRYCGTKVLTEIAATDPARKNEVLITQAEIDAAGVKNVNEYIKNGHGDIKVAESLGWGRSGLLALTGPYSVFDGDRACVNSRSGDVMMITMSKNGAKYDANGKTGTGGKYRALVGYEFAESKTVDTFTIYADNSTAPTAFDILGGKKNEDGTITWTVLASCTGMKADKYGAYNLLTSAHSVSFDPAEIDCFQIGIVTAPESTIYISEIELFSK